MWQKLNYRHLSITVALYSIAATLFPCDAFSASLDDVLFRPIKSKVVRDLSDYPDAVKSAVYEIIDKCDSLGSGVSPLEMLLFVADFNEDRNPDFLLNYEAACVGANIAYCRENGTCRHALFISTKKGGLDKLVDNYAISYSMIYMDDGFHFSMIGPDKGCKESQDHDVCTVDSVVKYQAR